MTDTPSFKSHHDPVKLNWAELELPNTWADQFNFRNPMDVFRFFRGIVGRKRHKVRLPDSVPGVESIPKYALQEFHSLPNGNYSKRVTRGYITGFDHSMLGVMTEARQCIAKTLEGCSRVLDAGCAGGRTARTLKEAGATDVWGIDPSPYLLQHASNDNPDISFVQGVAEDTGFSDNRFDGIAACFLFHEIPPRYLANALTEFNRILETNGLVAICEPSPLQVDLSLWQILKKFGIKGFYFGVLARFVFEPFLGAWHKQSSQKGMFEQYGFECVSDDIGMPLRHIVLRKKHSLT
ncbi:MAG: class I SAM-dependent methyltransferase [Cellvibrionaceae bacterium]